MGESFNPIYSLSHILIGLFNNPSDDVKISCVIVAFVICLISWALICKLVDLICKLICKLTCK